MATRDLYNNLISYSSIAPAGNRTASVNGTGVNTQFFESVLVEITVATVTDGTHTFEVQESSDNSTYTAVASADLLGTEPAVTSANDNAVYTIGYIGSEQYVRVITTVSGSPATGGIYAANVILGNARHAPTQ